MKHRVWFLMSAVAVVVLALVSAAPAQADGKPGILTIGGVCRSPTNGSFQVSYTTMAQPYNHLYAQVWLTSASGIAAAYMNLYSGDSGIVAASITNGIASASVTSTASAPYATMYYDGHPSGHALVTVTIDAGGPDRFIFNATYQLDCSSGSMVVRRIFARESTPALPRYTGIHLQSAEFVAPYLDVPNDAGLKPCGVFDVNGWGRKYIGLGDFPACQPPDLTVLCLNDTRQWVAGAVSDVYVRPDGAELDFTSSQHGICGIFPAK
jgi:hypothetical protein